MVLVGSGISSAFAWETMAGCRLVTKEYFDGDSFQVRGGGRERIFRLYAVDAPETENNFPQRLKEQRQHFKVGQKALLDGALQAKELTASLLANPFTIETKWVDARGESSKPRYFAKVTLSDGSDLGVRLVAAGLARNFGMREGLSQAYLSRLRKAEERARVEQRGLWGAGGTRAAPSSAGAGSRVKEAPASAEKAPVTGGLDTPSIFERLQRESAEGL